VIQVPHLFPEQLTLFRIQFQVGLPQPFEHLPQVVELLLKRAANDDGIKAY